MSNILPAHFDLPAHFGIDHNPGEPGGFAGDLHPHGPEVFPVVRHGHFDIDHNPGEPGGFAGDLGHRHHDHHDHGHHDDWHHDHHEHGHHREFPLQVEHGIHEDAGREFDHAAGPVHGGGEEHIALHH